MRDRTSGNTHSCCASTVQAIPFHELNHADDAGKRWIAHMQTNSIGVVLQGSSLDAEQDKVNYQWEQIDGAIITLDSDTNSVATFTAKKGEYTFRLTVTDSYGASVMDEAVVKIHPEPNSGPSAEIEVRASN